jgi:DNA polymerase I
MLQLVNDKVHVLNPPKDNLICDAAKVEEILGVPPSKVIDVMALRGDSVDNIPGAPGIGDKGVGRTDSALSEAWSRRWNMPRKSRRRRIANRCRTIATIFFTASNW